MNTNIVKYEQSFLDDIKTIIQQGQSRAYRAINTAMLETYWNLGKRIVEQEQQGKERADYGTYLIANLSEILTEEFGKGYSARNLRDFRQFYLTFQENVIWHTACAKLQLSENQDIKILHTACAELEELTENIIQHNESTILHTLCAELQSVGNQAIEKSHTLCGEFNASLFGNLSWSHIRSIMRVDNPQTRLWYLKEADEQMWSVRTLDRNIGSQYYERMLLTQHQDLVKNEMLEKTADLQIDKLEFIKNPVIAEFLGFSQNANFTESDLEKSILSNLEQFVLELGKGFAFVARQQHIRTEERDYFIDLVFYNYILKSFVLIDLKTTQITYQDVGQMDMYVQMYDQLKRTEDDNSTVGIILCSETDKDVARYSILGKNSQLFASKYKLYLPTEEELRREIERQKEIYRLQMENKK
ncbi:MAG: PDDEXK nuclease domain-containing protein [Prevotellaceae bacterium]|jgi:predicted nuclease of restriction endonuclease-like (RecB) superfamily|nr:PDDEXK nuclease domain-containing protein [Prevotellaceae bacterium]